MDNAENYGSLNSENDIQYAVDATNYDLSFNLVDDG